MILLAELLLQNTTIAALSPVDALTGRSVTEGHWGPKSQPWREFIEISATKGDLFTFDRDKESQEGNIRLLSELDDKGAGG